MAFLAGSVSFSRFRVSGGSPKRLDENLLEKFREHRIGGERVMRSDREETGWIGGRHLLDCEFDIEKNVLLDCLHFGMRIDASRIPPDLLRAYVQMEIDSLDHAAGNGARAAQRRRRARQAADRRAEREIKEGRFRRLRQFPMLFDTRNDVLYAGATSPAVHERLHPLFKKTFGKRLEPMTAGQRACAWAEDNGLARRLENHEPARFVPHPSGNGHPPVYWTANDPASRDELGNEFLLWLWHHLAERTDTIRLADETDAAVVIVRQLVLECPWAETGKETIVCDGPTQLPESRQAIRTGKLPRRAGLIVSRQGAQYEFTLQAESLGISAATLPKIEANGNGHARARMEERIEQIRHLAQTIDLLYAAFLKRRLSSAWPNDVEHIKNWIRTA
ncbi:MAG: hypothetical protein ACE5FC_09340 [Myxococcota bacterium]